MVVKSNMSHLKYTSHKSHEQSPSDEQQKTNHPRKNYFLMLLVYKKIFVIHFCVKEISNISLKFLKVLSMILLSSDKKQMA